MKFPLLRFGLVLIAAALGRSQISSEAATRAAPPIRVYVGGYTGSASRGIYLFDFDPTSGALTPRGLAGETVSPSFLVINPTRRFVYAANEIENFGGKKSGAVSAFSIDPAAGKLTLLDVQPSGGRGPCHLALDRSAQWVAVANYGSGSTAVLPVEKGGRLGPPVEVIQHQGSSVNPQRQSGPHAHCVTFSPDNRLLYVNDLGLDKILIYDFDSKTGKLRAHQPAFLPLAPGSGPRHFAFNPRHLYAYDINEMKSTIAVFSRSWWGNRLKQTETVSTLPPDFVGSNTGAEIAVHPSGKFVYASNRGANTIAVFAVNRWTGFLHSIQAQSVLGQTPRNFAIDPSGHFIVVANQDSNNLVVLKIDPNTGRLSPAGVSVNSPTPTCVAFAAEGP